uniref:Peptidase S1 domain-containing protein n=1 Tax=Anopheles farauti TaxID=69004 RepID=A0A182QK41_9DIPT
MDRNRVHSLVFHGVVIIGCLHLATAELFPEHIPELDSLEELMPNMERSVKDCPYTIYGNGGISLASSIFVERYIDKSYSHTVQVLHGEVTCVGLIVDENHVLTSSECATTGDEALPVIKLTNKTEDSIETAEIFSHPNFNVTLLRLNSTITFTVLAVPSCFWDVPYEDGFDKIQSISAAPDGNLTLEETKCTYQTRQECLSNLLKTSAMLQTRAIADYRMHPFVFTFGLNEEGSALSVSNYIDWMGEVIGHKIKSSECVSDYAEFRDYEDAMGPVSNDFRTVQYSKSRFSGSSINQFKVRILPNTTENGSKRHCYGSLIAPKFVLTAANCLKQYDVRSYNIEMAQRNQYYPVRDNKLRVHTVANKVHYHPEFDVTTLANDIALLELVKPLYDFNQTVLPACIWSREKLPVDEFQTNGYAPFNETDDETARSKHFYVTADVYDECVEKVLPNQICAGYPTALAPNTCHNAVGSAMSRSLYTFNRYFEYIFAINSKGENCGFNIPTVYTRIAPYVQWIDSIIFASKVHYKDDTNYYGDRCQDADGSEGTCVSLQYCPKLDQAAKEGKVVTASPSCSFGKKNELVVCCSEENVLSNEEHREQLTKVIEEIDSCKHLYHEFRKNKSPYLKDNFPSYPYLVRIHGKDDRSCNGTLISKQFVLTTAICYENLAQDEVMVISGNTSRQKMVVERTYAHPEFSQEPTEFNLMLLKLKNALTIDNETIPACLWTNQTHTPLRLEEVFTNRIPMHHYCYPIFNEDCERKYPDSNVTSTQLCVEQDKMFHYPRFVIDSDAGSALVSHFAQGVEEYQITYLVGLYGSGREVEILEDEDDSSKRFYGVYQRISEYYKWIKNVILVEMQKH